MNDTNKMSSAIFTHSGCLTGDALMLFVSSSLKGKDQVNALKHITACPLCSDAADGLRMWMKENKTEQNGIETSSPENQRTSEFSGKRHIAQAPKTNANGFTKTLFHVRTDAINQRIKQRLRAHSKIEDAEKKRLSYKPFVWLSAAATILLFIVIGYVLWLQNQLYAEKLAGERASEMLMLEGSRNQDTLAVSLPGKRTVLAMRDKTDKGIAYPVQSISGAIGSNEGVIRQDMFSAESQAAGTQDISAGKEIAQENEAINASRYDKSYSTPNDNNVEIEEESRPVFTMVEEMPAFPGGETARIRFLSENITYPKQAIEKEIQGTVYVSFIITADGKVTDGKILRGIGGGCDREALRVVKMMPLWSPGKQDGKLVDVLYTMPIVFRLSK